LFGGGGGGGVRLLDDLDFEHIVALSGRRRMRRRRGRSSYLTFVEFRVRLARVTKGSQRRCKE
jgi:hypothetical protein